MTDYYAITPRDFELFETMACPCPKTTWATFCRTPMDDFDDPSEAARVIWDAAVARSRARWSSRQSRAMLRLFGEATPPFVTEDDAATRSLWTGLRRTLGVEAGSHGGSMWWAREAFPEDGSSVGVTAPAQVRALVTELETAGWLRVPPPIAEHSYDVCASDFVSLLTFLADHAREPAWLLAHDWAS